MRLATVGDHELADLVALVRLLPDHPAGQVEVWHGADATLHWDPDCPLVTPGEALDRVGFGQVAQRPRLRACGRCDGPAPTQFAALVGPVDPATADWVTGTLKLLDQPPGAIAPVRRHRQLHLATHSYRMLPHPTHTNDGALSATAQAAAALLDQVTADLAADVAAADQSRERLLNEAEMRVAATRREINQAAVATTWRVSVADLRFAVDRTWTSRGPAPHSASRQDREAWYARVTVRKRWFLARRPQLEGLEDLVAVADVVDAVAGDPIVLLRIPGLTQPGTSTMVGLFDLGLDADYTPAELRLASELLPTGEWATGMPEMVAALRAALHPGP